MAKLKDRYANALLAISEENNTLKKDLEQAVFVRDALKDDEIQAFLVHPRISDSNKHELFHNAFSGKLNKYLYSFLHLMIRKNRESLIVPALTVYIDVANRRLGQIEAKIVSAKALTERQIESIRSVLSKKLHMSVAINATVDTDVIGGFYILVDGCIFDGTIRSELNRMKEHLKRGSCGC